MQATALAIEPQPNLRAEFAERIKAAWHKSREKIIALGRALIEARQKLAASDFDAMVKDDLPFGPANARRFMRVASDPKLCTTSYSANLPETLNALEELQKLDDLQFEAGIATGRIHDAMTVRDARSLVTDFKRQCGHDAPAPYAVPRLHRPHAKHLPPSTPSGTGAVSLSELVYLLRERRHALKLSQAEVDHKIGWAESLCSKYEILHDDDGRAPSIEAILELCQALKCGLQVVAL